MEEHYLAENASWKQKQENTYVKWIDWNLQTSKDFTPFLTITQLGDGVSLYQLVEILSKRKIKGIHKKPRNKPQKRENVKLVLSFLEEHERIKLVNIRTDAFEEDSPNKKIMLGFIWTLILHYTVGSMWEGEEPAHSDKVTEQRLLLWIQKKVVDVRITNFTTSWNDCRAIGGLVDAVGPGLCPDYMDWKTDKTSNLENATTAISLAEKYLGVVPMVTPEDMLDPKVDEKCMVLYLSQFPTAKLKPEAPLRPRLNPARVRVYGPGVQREGNQAGGPARFTIETFSAGKGKLEVDVKNPQGGTEKCDVVFNNDKNLTYSCVFVPPKEGKYTVTVKYGSKMVPGSPFTVNVGKAAADASKVQVEEGFRKMDVIASRLTKFQVHTKDAGKGSVDVVITDPDGRKDSVRPRITKINDDLTTVEFGAIQGGSHAVSIYYAGNHIPGSPFNINVKSEGSSPRDSISPERFEKTQAWSTSSTPPESKTKSTGSGVPGSASYKIPPAQTTRVGQRSSMTLRIPNTNLKELEATVTTPSGEIQPCEITSTAKDLYTFSFVPKMEGMHAITIKCAGMVITGVFNVYTREAGAGELSIFVKGPSKGEIEAVDKMNGTSDVSYTVPREGEYEVSIKYNDQHIHNSPFKVLISPSEGEFRKVTVPSFPTKGISVNEEISVPINLNGAKGRLRAFVTTPDNTIIETSAIDQERGLTYIRFRPSKIGLHLLNVLLDGHHIPGSAFKMMVGDCEAFKVTVSGDGLRKAKAGEWATIILKSWGEGEGHVVLNVKGPGELMFKNETKKEHFELHYLAKTPGTYMFSFKLSGINIAGSPFKVEVTGDGPRKDPMRTFMAETTVEFRLSVQTSTITTMAPQASRCVASGSGLTTAAVGRTNSFTVNTANAGNSVLLAGMMGPDINSPMDELVIKHTGKDMFTVSYKPTRKGEHMIFLCWGLMHIPGSPFSVTVK